MFCLLVSLFALLMKCFLFPIYSLILISALNWCLHNWRIIPHLYRFRLVLGKFFFFLIHLQIAPCPSRFTFNRSRPFFGLSQMPGPSWRGLKASSRQDARFSFIVDGCSYAWHLYAFLTGPESQGPRAARRSTSDRM